MVNLSVQLIGISLLIISGLFGLTYNSDDLKFSVKVIIAELIGIGIIIFGI